MLYDETGTQTTVTTSAGTLAESGSGADASTMTSAGVNSGTYGYDAGSANGTLSMYSNDSYSFSMTDDTSSASTASSTYYLLQAGSYNLYSYSLTCVVYTQSGAATFTSSEATTTSDSGSGSSSSFYYGAVNGNTNYQGVQNTANGLVSSATTVTYAETDATSLTSSTTGSNSYSLAEKGSYSFGSYSLSTVVYTEGASATAANSGSDTSLQTGDQYDTGLTTGSGINTSSTSYGSMNLTGTTTVTSSDSLDRNNSSYTSFTQTGSGSYSLYRGRHLGHQYLQPYFRLVQGVRRHQLHRLESEHHDPGGHFITVTNSDVGNLATNNYSGYNGSNNSWSDSLGTATFNGTNTVSTTETLSGSTAIRWSSPACTPPVRTAWAA